MYFIVPYHIWRGQVYDTFNAVDHIDTHSDKRKGGKGNMTTAMIIAAMAGTTMALRFLPFLVFGKDTPKYIAYGGRKRPLVRS